MRRSIALAILAGVCSFAAVVPGSADPSGEAGFCSLSGTAAFANPVAAAPGPNDFTFSGGVQCSSATRTFAGDLTAEGTGTIGCALELSDGAFRVEIPTGDGTREVWSGQFATVGSAAGALIGNLTQISQETFNEETQEWESDGDPFTPNLTVLAGTIAFNAGQEEIDGCLGDGVSEAEFNGNVAFAHGAA